VTAPGTEPYRLDELAKLASEQGLEWRRKAGAPDDELTFEVGRCVFTRLERSLKREGYLDPTDGDAPEALDRWWTRATSRCAWAR